MDLFCMSQSLACVVRGLTLRKTSVNAHCVAATLSVQTVLIFFVFGDAGSSSSESQEQKLALGSQSNGLAIVIL